MEEFWITLLSIAAGSLGYLIVTFWVQPILRYREIKYRVAADLVFFANALDLQKQNGSFREDTLNRMKNNRRCAAELAAIFSDLPLWYRWLLCMRSENPLEASKNLIGLSNSTAWRDAEKFIEGVKMNLKLSVKDA